jgi:hypothetical protein
VVVLPTNSLVRTVGGVLLLYGGLRPGHRVVLRSALAALGIYADHCDISHAVETLRSDGFIIEAEARRAGYRFVDLALVPLTRGRRRRRPAPAAQTRLL